MPFSGSGAGTIGDPYQITTLAQLQEMDSYLSSYFKLMNDIDASPTKTDSGTYPDGFIPIGTYGGTPFSGALDGNNKSIDRLYINLPSTAGVGLFAYAKNTGTNYIKNNLFTGGATSWTLGSGWDYYSNSARKQAGDNGTLSQALIDMNSPIVIGETYTLRFTLISVTAGSVVVSCGGSSFGTMTKSKTYTVSFTATTTDPLTFTPTTDAALRVDNIYLYKNFGGIVKNLSITNAEIIAGRLAGVLVGDLRGSEGVVNVSVQGTLSTDSATPTCGGMAGYSASEAGFSNCSATVDITDSGTGSLIGGFVGDVDNGIFESCASSGTITLTAYNANEVGGFAGYMQVSYVKNCQASNIVITDAVNTAGGEIGFFIGTGNTCYFEKCFGQGVISTLATSPEAIVGGFIGLDQDNDFVECYASGLLDAKDVSLASIGGFSGFSTGYCSFQNCYAQVTVASLGTSDTDGFFGGFIGFTDSTVIAISNCYCAGYVHPDSINSGAFIGKNASSTYSATACFYDSDISEATNAVGVGVSTGITGKTTAEMKTVSTYYGWDFITVWELLTPTQPAVNKSNLTVWCSANGDYENFEESTLDDASFQLTIPSTNEIRWIDSQESLIVGTAGDEWKIASNRLDTPLSPTNFGVKRQSGHGSAYIQSVQINEVVLFVNYVKRKVLEMTYDSNIAKYVCPDLTALAEQVTAGQVKWMAYQRNPDSILWCGTIDGKLISLSYDREQNMTSWAEHPMDNAFIQAGCVIPDTEEDILYLLISRTINAEEKSYIERLEFRDYGGLQKDQFYLDCGVKQESTTPFTVVTGLDHLEGETVSALADGAVILDLVVASGQVTLPVASTTAIVGLPYRYVLQPMRLNLGENWASMRRSNTLTVSFFDTLDAQYGISTDETFEIDWRATENYDSPPALFSGEKELTYDGGFTDDSPIVITGDSPNGCNVRCIIADLDITD